MTRLVVIASLLTMAGCHWGYTKAEWFDGFDHRARIDRPRWCSLEVTPCPDRAMFRLVHSYVAIPDWQAPAAEYLEFVLPSGKVRMGRAFDMEECNAWSVARPYWIGRGQVGDGTIRIVRQGKAEIEIEISSTRLGPPITGVHLFKLANNPPAPLKNMLIEKARTGPNRR